MKKFFSSMAGMFRLPPHLKDNSLKNGISSFLKDERKMTILFFVIISLGIVSLLYTSGAFETPSIINPIHASETPKPAYSTSTPISTLISTPSLTPKP